VWSDEAGWVDKRDTRPLDIVIELHPDAAAPDVVPPPE